MALSLTSASCLCKLKLSTEQKWLPRFLILESGVLSWYLDEGCTHHGESTALASTAVLLADDQDDEGGEESAVVHVDVHRGDSKVRLQLRLSIEEAQIWRTLINLHYHRYADSYSPSSLNLREGLELFRLSAPVTVSAGSSTLDCEVSINEDASEKAHEIKVLLDGEDLLAFNMHDTEKQIIRAQSKIISEVANQHIVWNRVASQRHVALIRLEERAHLAELQCAELTQCLERITGLVAHLCDDTVVNNTGDELRSSDQMDVELWHTLAQEERSIESDVMDVDSSAVKNEEWVDEDGDDEPTWVNRYFLLRKKFAMAIEELRVSKSSLMHAQEDLTNLSDNIIHDEIVQENRDLREQTLILRGEILKLSTEITAIRDTAMNALKSFSCLTGGIDQKDAPSQLVQLATIIAGAANTEVDQELCPGESSIEAKSEAVEDSKNVKLSMEDNPLQLAANAVAHIPAVADRILKKIFDSYCTSDRKSGRKKNRISLRELKIMARDYGLIVDRNGAGSDPKEANMVAALNYGEFELVVNRCRSVIEIEEEKHVTNAVKTSNDINLPHRSFKIKGYSARKPKKETELPFTTFIFLLQQLSLRVFAKFIELETGLLPESLTDADKSTLLTRTWEMLLIKKLVPVACDKELIPWELIQIESMLIDLEEWSKTEVIDKINSKCRLITRWFLLYAGPMSEEVSQKGSDIGNKNAAITVKRTSISLDALVHGEEDVFLSKDSCELESRSKAGLPYKALSKLAHDLGLIPYIYTEQRLYRLFQELIAWLLDTETVAINSLPNSLRRKLRMTLRDFYEHPVPPPPTTMGANSAESLNIAAFMVLLFTIAVQVSFTVHLCYELSKASSRHGDWHAELSQCSGC